MLVDFDPAKAFTEAFDGQLASYPEDTAWKVSGRPSKEYPSGEDENWWRAKGPEMVKRWVDWRSSHPDWSIWVAPDGQPGIELGAMVHFEDQLFKLFIDRLFIVPSFPTGPIVVDLKSGAAPQYGNGQLGLYKVAVEILYPGVKVAGGAFWNSRTGELGPISTLNQYSPRLFAAYARRVDEIRRRGLYLPNVGPLCKSCKVGRFCAINGGTDSHMDPDFELFG